MDAPLACWRCEQPGHGYADCDREPAATQQELDARIDRLLERWDAGFGEIPTSLKAQFVTAERNAYRKARGK